MKLHYGRNTLVKEREIISRLCTGFSRWQMMALYESEDSESINETLVAQGLARVARDADKLATSQVGG